MGESCHSSSVEDRGLLVEFDSQFLPFDLKDGVQVARLRSKCLYLMSHLPGCYLVTFNKREFKLNQFYQLSDWGGMGRKIPHSLSKFWLKKF